MATENPKIFINIYAGEGSGNGSGSGNNEMSASKEETFMKSAKQALGALGIASAAKQLINYTTSHVGIETGNYQLQRNISNTMRVAGLVGGGIVALKAGGPLGLAAYGIGLGVREFIYQDSFAYEKRMNDIALTAFRERAATYNRSRTLDQ